ncbi:hypothetical protein [Streptomyces sp. NPDC002587]
MVDAVGAGTSTCTCTCTCQPEHRAALSALRALAAGDRPGCDRAPTALLEHHRARHSAEAVPRAALPAAARRHHPRVAGAPARRVVERDRLRPPPGGPGPLLRGRGTAGCARTAAGSAPTPWRRWPRSRSRSADLDQYDEYARQQWAEFSGADTDTGGITGLLLELTGRELRRFRLRAAVDPQGRDERQREALLSAAEAGAGALSLMRAEPGTEVDVAVGGTTRRLTATGGVLAGRIRTPGWTWWRSH